MRHSLPLLLFCCCAAAVQAQDALKAARLDALSADSSSIVEKSDWTRYDNGAYTGHVYREVRASIVPQGGKTEGSQSFRGNFFVLEETLRDLKASARAVNAVVPAQFRVFKNGSLEIKEDRGFPALRGFPAYSGAAVLPGDKWTAEGERALDPLGDGNMVIVPFLAEYEYKGVELYKDIPVHRIHARYAARYSPGRARPVRFAVSGGAPFNGLSGKHDVDILIRVSNGALLLSRDNLDETFFWPDGKSVRFRGFTLTFGQQLLPMNRDTLAADIASVVDPLSGVQVSKVEEGVRLTLRDLRFKPDSSELVSGEERRLDSISDVLKKTPDRAFLVEGHTAAAGTRGGEIELSVARAKRIVDEFCARGIDAGRFIYKGWGSEKSVASNETEEGRMMNRRVEITIIE